MHTHTHTHVHNRIDVQIHTHMHMYTNIHVRIHTHIHIYTRTHTKCIYKHTQARLAANVQGAVADQGSFALLFRSTQSNHISHLQCKDFIVPTSCSTNTPPAVQQSRSTRARRNPSPRMVKVTVHEKRRVNEEQPTPASSPSRKSRQRGTQTTATNLHWCEANPPSSWSTHVASSGVDAPK